MIRIVFNGQFLDVSGYGQAVRSTLRAIDSFIKTNPDKIEMRINVISFDKQRALSDDEQRLINKYLFTDAEEIKDWLNSEYIFIGHHTPNVFVSHDINQPFLANAKVRINYTVWETTHIPLSWKKIGKSDKIDYFILPSVWNKEVFELDTGKKSFLLPHPIDEPKHRAKEALGDPKGEFFKTLAVSQWTHRKGFDTLIRAWLMEFDNDPNAVLYIKSYRADSSESEQKAIMQEITNIRNTTAMANGRKSTAKIRFIGDLLNREQMDGIYEGCDLFALCSRGEGVGLPYTEAIMHEKPVLCTDKGGHVDFVDYDSNYVIPSHYDSCHSLGAFYDSNMEWIESRIIDVRNALRNAYDDWKSGKIIKKGKLAKQFMLNQSFDNESIGERFYQIIEGISNE